MLDKFTAKKVVLERSHAKPLIREGGKKHFLKSYREANPAASAIASVFAAQVVKAKEDGLSDVFMVTDLGTLAADVLETVVVHNGRESAR